MKPGKLERIARDLLRAVGAARDACVLAWDAGETPRIVDLLFHYGPDARHVVISGHGEHAHAAAGAGTARGAGC